MKRKRRNLSSEFKTRIALEAIKGMNTVQQIAAENDLHPVQVPRWKTAMAESAAGIFERGRDQVARAADEEKQKERLERKVGQFVVEVDWLKEKVQGVGDRSMRKAMVDPENEELSIRRQCELLGVNRNRLQRRVTDLDEEELTLARRLDELHLRFPEFGTRRMSQWLLREGRPGVTRRRIGKVMKRTGLAAIYRRSRTSQPAPREQNYPYLLRERTVDSPDEVWCADVTYILMARGFAYLVAVMDWKTRAVLS